MYNNHTVLMNYYRNNKTTMARNLFATLLSWFKREKDLEKFSLKRSTAYVSNTSGPFSVICYEYLTSCLISFNRN